MGVVAIESFITNEYNHKNAKCAAAKTAMTKYNDCNQSDRNIRRPGTYCDQSNGQQADCFISFRFSDKKSSILKCRSHGHDSPLKIVYCPRQIFIAISGGYGFYRYTCVVTGGMKCNYATARAFIGLRKFFENWVVGSMLNGKAANYLQLISIMWISFSKGSHRIGKVFVLKN